MRRLSILLALAASLAFAGAVSAAPNKLRTEVGGTDATAAVYSTSSARITAAPGSYAAIYTTAKAPAGKMPLKVDMGFLITVDGQSGTVSGGAPRLTIPIDFNNDGTWDDFASLDWASCGGTVDADSKLTSSVLVSTTSATCGVNLNGGGSFANWDAFAAANPTYRIAKGQQAFIIADWGPTAVTLTGIDLN
jgi:hypothetical protein